MVVGWDSSWSCAVVLAELRCVVLCCAVRLRLWITWRRARTRLRVVSCRVSGALAESPLQSTARSRVEPADGTSRRGLVNGHGRRGSSCRRRKGR